MEEQLLLALVSHFYQKKDDEEDSTSEVDEDEDDYGPDWLISYDPKYKRNFYCKKRGHHLYGF